MHPGNERTAWRTRQRRAWWWRLAAANAVVGWVLWLVEAFVAERHWLTTLVTYLPQHAFGLPTLLLLLVAARRRDWLLGGISLATGAFLLVALMGFTVPLPSTPKPTGVRVRVMTYNIHHAMAGAAPVAAVIRQIDPDIVCLQEAGALRPWPDPVPRLQALLPGWQVVRHGEAAIFTRYPVLSYHGQSVPNGGGRMFLTAQVSLKGRRLSLVNTHLSTAAHPRSLARGFRCALEELRQTTTTRNTQAAALLAVARRLPAPVVIAGDLNTPPRGLLYQQVTIEHRDLFAAAGLGLGSTFPAPLPLLRIDYLLATRDLHAHRCFVPRLRASDHRPVVAEIDL